MSDPIILPALVGALVAAIGAVVQNALSKRAKIDESLRGERIAQYRLLWKKTGRIPKWPRAADVTYATLDTLTHELKEWYFDGGGICLSAKSRTAYGTVQKTLTALLKPHKDTLQVPVPPEQYDELQDCMSLLRTELTRDLLSRSRTSFVFD